MRTSISTTSGRSSRQLRTAHLEVHGQPGAADRGDERLQPVDAGLGRALRAGVGAPFRFQQACKVHDYGYDLLRYAHATGQQLTGEARRQLDGNPGRESPPWWALGFLLPALATPLVRRGRGRSTSFRPGL